MPSFYDCQEYYRAKSNGEQRRFESSEIMEDTWWEDIESQVAYLYDYYHDDYKTQLENLHPKFDHKKTPIAIKYIAHTSQTFSKDIITYHIQLRPSQRVNVDYYNEFFADRYGAHFPNGLYIDIKDNKGKYNRWLIVAGANYYDSQFSTFEILPCDYVFQWIYKEKKYQMAGVLRSQNSYNSGVWFDSKIQSVEDQQKFIVPLNRISENIYYDMRMIIDAPVLTEPRAWSVSKVNRIASSGLANITLAQDRFDQFSDYIELDTNGNVIGMWADYYKLPAPPEDSTMVKDLVINYSGLSPEIKVRGGYKTYSVSSSTSDDISGGTWSFSIDGVDASDLVQVSEDNAKIKVKFIGDEMYLGKTLVVAYTIEEITAHLNVSIISL